MNVLRALPAFVYVCISRVQAPIRRQKACRRDRLVCGVCVGLNAVPLTRMHTDALNAHTQTFVAKSRDACTQYANKMLKIKRKESNGAATYEFTVLYQFQCACVSVCKWRIARSWKMVCVCVCADCWRRQRCRDYGRNYFYSIYDDIVHSYSSRRMCRRISDNLST